MPTHTPYHWQGRNRAIAAHRAALAKAQRIRRNAVRSTEADEQRISYLAVDISIDRCFQVYRDLLALRRWRTNRYAAQAFLAAIHIRAAVADNAQAAA